MRTLGALVHVMSLFQQILSATGIQRPDGRPLYALPISPEIHSEIGQKLRARLASGHVTDSTAAGFVLWAAEHIRARFKGGQLTWEFVFQGLGLREDRDAAVQLVKDGLHWWNRKVRESEAGHRLYLYTLMAEGGLPQALLVQAGHYQRVIKGLLSDIEAECIEASEIFAYRIAERRVMDLPQAFQSEDIVRLLANLGISLVRLRRMVPADVPLELVDRWLDRHRPNWLQDLPLRMSQEVADTLIRPALRTERSPFVSGGALAWRALVRNEVGESWRAVVKIAEHGALATAMLPEADGLRLRLLPTGQASDRAGSLIFAANPEEGGWSLRRIGGRGALSVPVGLDAPLTLSAFADGHQIGETEVVTALPSPEEDPSLWCAADASEGIRTRELLPLSSTGNTRGRFVWLLTASDAQPHAGEGLTLSEPEPASEGVLRQISGRGVLRLGERYWRIATEADEETPEGRLFLRGPSVSGWRLAGNGGHLFCGTPQFICQRGAGAIVPLRSAYLRKRSARLLMSTIAEWVEKDVVLARLRYVALPEGARLTLRETGPGELEFQAERLPDGLSVSLTAGTERSWAQVSDGAARLSLSVPGVALGMVMLRLADPRVGTELKLTAPWPARSGVILSPDGNRLERDTPISVEALRGWRAILPEGVAGDLQFRLDGHVSVAMRVGGEVALAAHMPLIRSMLAQGGPDAQVNLSLITGGAEGRRLEIRRYDRQAIARNDYLRFGLARDEPMREETAFSDKLGRGTVEIHAVNLIVPGRALHRQIVATGPIALPPMLSQLGGGPWLIQAIHDGQVQRAVVWGDRSAQHPTRDARISSYVGEWARLLQSPEDPQWERLWMLIRSASEGGDAGVLDQVQALARTPAAAVALVLRVPRDDLSDALALDLAAPIFWAAQPVAAFRTALIAERSRLVARYAQVLEPSEAESESNTMLFQRIGAILALHPELAGHFGTALAEAGLMSIASTPGHREALERIFIPDPVKHLVNVAQEAARRFDRLPSGVRGIMPRNKPDEWPSFNPDAQPMIDAPLVTAEIATERRPAPDTASMLTLINLRLIDPSYFDSALPAALALILQRTCS